VGRPTGTAPRILQARVRGVTRHATRGAARTATAAGLVALAALGLLMLVPTLLGYQRYVIEGGSMGHALPKGSIAYEETIPTGDIRKGDVITYRPPGATALRTHRVIWLGISPKTGERIYRTKGDANPTQDRPTFTLPHRTQARVKLHVPLAGYAVEALAIKSIRMAVIGAPSLAIALITLTGLWRDRRRTTPAFG
jgi:signal peptidase